MRGGETYISSAKQFRYLRYATAMRFMGAIRRTAVCTAALYFLLLFLLWTASITPYMKARTFQPSDISRSIKNNKLSINYYRKTFVLLIYHKFILNDLLQEMILWRIAVLADWINDRININIDYENTVCSKRWYRRGLKFFGSDTLRNRFSVNQFRSKFPDKQRIDKSETIYLSIVLLRSL